MNNNITRRNFIKVALFLNAQIIGSSLTACKGIETHYENYYVVTYNTENGKKSILTYYIISAYTSSNSYMINVCGNGLANDKTLVNKASSIDEAYKALEEYFDIVSVEPLLKLLVEKYGYKDRYDLEEIEGVMENEKPKELSK